MENNHAVRVKQPTVNQSVFQVSEDDEEIMREIEESQMMQDAENPVDTEREDINQIIEQFEQQERVFSQSIHNNALMN